MRILANAVIIMCLLFGISAHADETEEPGVIHTVVIWLKEPGNTEHRQQAISASKKLKEIPGVLDLRVGEVIAGERKVIDSSYDVALYLRFGNKEDLQNYLVHPIHKSLVKDDLGPIIERYKVYDFTDE